MAESFFKEQFGNIKKIKVCTTTADLNFDTYTEPGTYEIYEDMGSGQNRIFFLTVDKSVSGACLKQTRIHCGIVDARQTDTAGAWTAWEALSGGGSVDLSDYYTKTEIDNFRIADEMHMETHVGMRLDESLGEIDSQMDELESIAKGRATGYVFDTLADLEAWLSDSANTANLVLGDNLYIRATDVPDYWWDGESKQELETQKVDLTEYVKNTDYAALNKVGVVSVNSSWGINATNTGALYIQEASETQIAARKGNYNPITPAKLEYAVKSVGDGYYVTVEQMGEIDTALDRIISIQNELIGG